MSTRQDSSHPTGVTDSRPRGGGRHVALDATGQRNRKADAALSMKLSGASWSEVAATLGFPTPRAAMLATEKALVRRLDNEDDKTKLRMMSGARLERLLRGIWTKAISPDDPEQMTAVSRSREIIADYNKLFGLNAPAEVVVHSPTQSELEDWVLRMTATMVPEVEEPDIFEAEVVESEAV